MTVNHATLVTLFDREAFIQTLPPAEQAPYLFGQRDYPDGERVAVIRPPGCLRGIENSAAHVVVEKARLGRHYDLDIGNSVGEIEQLQAGNAEAGFQIFFRLLNGFIQLYGEESREMIKAVREAESFSIEDMPEGLRGVFWLIQQARQLERGDRKNLFRVARHEFASRCGAADLERLFFGKNWLIQSPINMELLRTVMDEMWSDAFLKQRGELLAMVTDAENGLSLAVDIRQVWKDGAKQAGEMFHQLYVHDASNLLRLTDRDLGAALDEAMEMGGRQAVLDFAIASSSLPISGKMAKLTLPNQKEPVVCTDGFFGHLGGYPIDIALKRGATKILLTLSTRADIAANLSEKDLAVFLFFLREKNKDARAAVMQGMRRSTRYLMQIAETGHAEDEEGRRAAVTMLQPDPDDPILSSIETRSHVLSQGAARGAARMTKALAIAQEMAGARLPKWFDAPAPRGVHAVGSPHFV